MVKTTLEAPSTFGPRLLKDNFDRFSVAYGLCLGSTGGVALQIAGELDRG